MRALFDDAELMSEGSTDPSAVPLGHADETDDRFLVRNPRQVRQLLRALIEKRALINAHVGGRDQSFSSAVLQVDEDDDTLLLDGSLQEASNRAAEQAGNLLCFAQLDKVLVRFRADNLVREQDGRHVAFRATIPDELIHLQRREMYRLETPITDSPQLVLPASESRAEAVAMRVVDISGGGLAVTLPQDCRVVSLQHRYQAELSLPEGPELAVGLVACNTRELKLANGIQALRVGFRFEDLPRGGDNAIQRYIFRIDRQRNARKNGDT